MFEPRWEPFNLAPPPLQTFEPPSYVSYLIDYPALLRAVRTVDDNAVPDLATMVNHARVQGPVFSAKAFGAWYDADETLHAFHAGVNPVFVEPSGPGAVPSTQALIAEGEALIEAEHISALVLSGDDRLLPLVQAARAKELPVALIGFSGTDELFVELVSTIEHSRDFARSLTRAEKYRRPRSAAR